MKYVVMRDESGKESIFIFSKEIHHDCAAEVFGRIKDQSTGRWNRVFREPVSAGFTDGVSCHGRSETLNLESRGIVDERLIY
jgi:hypothetical protein